MKTCVAIRHVAFEDLGLIEPLLARRGVAVRYVDAPLEPLPTRAITDADLVVVLGGPLGANDDARFPFVTDECRVIEARLAAGRPLLGVCLGAQLMARVLGGRVYPAPAKEIGWLPLTLTAAGQASALRHLAETTGEVLHWHGDTFDLPRGATLLASTTVCANQAFSVGAALGLQFHLEAEVGLIERWLVGHLHELESNHVDVAALRQTSRRLGPTLRPAFEAVFDSWLESAKET